MLRKHIFSEKTKLHLQREGTSVHTDKYRENIYSGCMISSPWPSVCIKSTRLATRNPTSKRTLRLFLHTTMVSVASETKHTCVATVLHLEDVQKEMPLLDHATRVADERILLALLSKFMQTVAP